VTTQARQAATRIAANPADKQEARDAARTLLNLAFTATAWQDRQLLHFLADRVVRQWRLNS
jgi:hypothetical protein